MADSRSFSPIQYPSTLGVEEARSRIVEVCSLRALPGEEVALEAALGRVTTAAIVAPFDVPGFTNSAMDGFALRGDELPASGERRFRLIGEVFAGSGAAADVVAGTCLRITTGAPMPHGADTVVMKESTRVDGDHVIVEAGTRSGANVRPAGEDYGAGDAAIARGSVLTPARIGVLASFGATRVAVSRRARAILLTTGDELVAPGLPLGFGQIHDSNRSSLGALLEQYGVALVRHERVRDDPRILREALVRAGADADIILSSGGVSAGEADYLPALIGELGTIHFWKVRIKPGMPFLFGEVGNALMFALPGNPVSGVAIFLTLLKPGLDAMSGLSAAPRRIRARLTHAIDKRHGRAEFQRASLRCDDEGCLHVTALPRQGSGMLRGVADADALVMLPEGARTFAAGDVVDVLPLAGWSR